LQTTSIGDPSADWRPEFAIVITALPATGRQRKVALGAIITMAVIFAITLPFASVHLVRIEAFVLATQSVMCAADLLTAALLYSQYSVYPQRALLVLASGYVFSGLFAFLEACAFPGVFVRSSLFYLGDELNTTAWLFTFWHTVFPLATILYALSKGARVVDRSGEHIRTIIGVTVACVVTATAALTWVATAGVEYLPRIFESANVITAFGHYSAHFLLLLSVTALVLLFVRRHTILDQWLLVVLLAWLPTFAVAALFTAVQFTLGWYIARVFALFAGSALLFVLLWETVALYTRLANAVVRLRRAERLERRLAAIVESSDDAIVSVDRDGIIMTWNRGAERLYGYSSTEVVGRAITMIFPPDRGNEEVKVLERVYRGGHVDHRETVRRRKDGSLVNVAMSVSPMSDESGTIIGASGIVRDITELKRFEKRQALLVSELDHRVKNILAQVAVVATSTRQGSPSVDEFLGSLHGRIQAMAVAHNLLSQAGWKSVGLDALVRSLLAPYATATNVTISGADVVLNSAETQALARVLHELATNAAKYGSLSILGGQISIKWTRKPNGAATNLSFVWRELGGPQVTSAVQPGYGTNLIRNLIPHELGGTVDLVFGADGVNCRIEFPIGQP
jgi:PAS domain S-box-containing protein